MTDVTEESYKYLGNRNVIQEPHNYQNIDSYDHESQLVVKNLGSFSSTLGGFQGCDLAVPQNQIVNIHIYVWI